MTKFYTAKGGTKKVKGKTYTTVVGSRAAVWHGTSHHTKGGLTKGDLMVNKRGRIVSKAKHATAKRERRLERAGYRTRKGHFGFLKTEGWCKCGKRGRQRSHSGHKYHTFMSPIGRRTRSRRYRGGNGVNYALTPSKFDGQGVGTSGVDLQFVAGNAA